MGIAGLFPKTDSKAVHSVLLTELSQYQLEKKKKKDHNNWDRSIDQGKKKKERARLGGAHNAAIALIYQPSQASPKHSEGQEDMFREAHITAVFFHSTTSTWGVTRSSLY